ncbi:MAG: hypothetical protein AMXMBFR64_27710 [Myxococcales bacterium]
MSEPARKRATYEDVLRAPEHLIAEVVDGELVTTPRPSPAHGSTSSVLGTLLNGPFQLGQGPGGRGSGPGGWWVIAEPELHLGGDVLVPDQAGWRRERMPALPRAAAFTMAPDWICEVLSPSTARLDRVRKLAAYASHGVRHAWLVDPLARTLEVLRLEGGRWSLIAAHMDDEVARIEPFDAIELDLSLWWPVLED